MEQTDEKAEVVAPYVWLSASQMQTPQLLYVWLVGGTAARWHGGGTAAARRRRGTAVHLTNAQPFSHNGIKVRPL